MHKNQEKIREGLKAGLPVAIGYIPIAIAFGLLSRSLGIPSYVSILMSLLIYAGASQFIGINLLILGATAGEIVMTTFILNLRHFLMAASLATRFEENIPINRRAFLAFGITDETFTVASLQTEEKLSGYFLFALNSMAFLSWNIGTWLGLFLAPSLPEIVKASMGIALYAMFIGLLVPCIKKSHQALVVSFFAVIINCLFAWLPFGQHVSNGWSIIAATLLSAALGAVLFPERGVES